MAFSGSGQVVAALGPETGRKQLPSSKERVYSPWWEGTAKLSYSRSSTRRQNSRAWYLSEQDALSVNSLERAIPSFTLSLMKNHLQHLNQAFLQYLNQA